MWFLGNFTHLPHPIRAIHTAKECLLGVRKVMEGVYKASELCPSYVWKDSGICLEVVRKEYWRCLEGLLMVSGRCLEVVWKVWKRCLEGVWNGRGLWSIKIFVIEFFTRFSCDSKVSSNQLFLPWNSSCSQMNGCKYANMVCKYAIIQFCKKITKVFLLEYVIMQLFTPYSWMGKDPCGDPEFDNTTI